MSDSGKDIKLFQLLVQVYSDSGKELKLQKDASSTGKIVDMTCDVCWYGTISREPALRAYR